MSKMFPDYFYNCFLDLFIEDKPFNIVVRGHLYCESALERLIRNCAKNADKLEINRANYALKLKIASGFEIIPSGIFPALDKLAYYRNMFVHSLEYRFKEKDQRDFSNTFKSQLEDKFFREVFSNYIDGDKTFPAQLRRIVLALWLLLEVDYLLKTEGLKAGGAISAILDETCFDDIPEVRNALQDTKVLLDSLFPEGFRNVK